MIKSFPKVDYPLIVAMVFLMLLGILILRSIAPALFPLYFLYIFLGVAVFLFFLQFDFEVVSLFSKFFYIGSIIFLILPLIVGQVTRGTIRWIPIGPLTIQPGEIVRPFLLVFFAVFLTEKELDLKRVIEAFLLFVPAFLLIAIQPSLGVAILTLAGFLGIFLALQFDKRYLLLGFLALIFVIPIAWQLLAPYQKSRLTTFLNSSQNPLTSGYNSVQSMIAVGSGGIFGRGLGKGTQTQLAFLPEKQTDFVFASISEELGLVGAVLVILAEFFMLFRLTFFSEEAVNPAARAFLAGLFVMLFSQVVVHVGMNVGLLPITGIPLPLVSAGGSSLLATMIGLGIALGTRKS